ncbi:hypothetical protein RHGRI_029591 [Rhododendron griersonianum]|uniref:Aminotransferase-like plant mobile domain-containing protein n=1 Tax=Rhododendron griersonianum TaxID=479676 RepID=A0AAV6IR18_9ERIC|nr:hypothetical protein RHGRI_029591 [Rhododendron griersonianum]
MRAVVVVVRRLWRWWAAVKKEENRRSSEDWGPLCEQLLGIVLVPGVDRKGGKVMMTWLREHFKGHLVAGYTEEDVRQQARGYILQLIGGVLMSDHSGSQVHLAYLTLLKDLTIVRSWGNACLSNIYHYYMPRLSKWWDDHFHSPDLATHVVGYYRNYFDMQRPNEVVWRPYNEELIASPSSKLQPLHGKDWKAGQKDYRQDHRVELEMWNNRLDHIVPAEEVDPYEYAYPANDPYVTWYEMIMIQYISRLGGGVDKVTIEDIDLDELRSIGEEGVGVMEYLEKWLRKRPPMAPNQPQVEGVNVVEQVDLLHEPAIEVKIFVAQEPVDPFIHNDAIPDTVDTGITSALQNADGGSVSSSFTAHLGSVPSYPFTPMFQSTSPLPIHTKMPFDSQDWFDSPLQNVGVLDTTFLGRPVFKRKQTLDGDDGGSSDAPQLGDDLVGMGGHPTVEGDAEVHAEVNVQGEQGEGDGVMTEAHVIEQEVKEEQDDTPPFVPRRSQRQPHLAACGTGSHKLLHYVKHRKDM